MNKFHQFFHSTLGKVLAGLLIVSALILGGAAISNMFRNSEYGDASRDGLFVCSQTGKTFHYQLQLGTEIPVPSPFSGKNTGYLAELCYWTADGQSKTDPTPVLLNTYMNQPEPTFCPDCQRLVVGHNPSPKPGRKPPLTKEEFDRRAHR